MRRYASLLWAFLVLAALVHLGFEFRTGLKFDTDMIALLPQDEQDPVVRAAVTEISSRLGRRFLLLVGGDSENATLTAARTVARIIAVGGIAETTAAPDPATVRKAITDLYFPYRDSLLSASDRARLQAGQLVGQRGEEALAGRRCLGVERGGGDLHRAPAAAQQQGQCAGSDDAPPPHGGGASGRAATGRDRDGHVGRLRCGRRGRSGCG